MMQQIKQDMAALREEMAKAALRRFYLGKER